LNARHLAIVGPTASGKSALALAFARRYGDVEIVSVDSMQVYRGMDIGTAKPTAAEQAEVSHHLIDLVEPDDEYTVSRFQADCTAVVAEIEQRGHRALLVGGTGLYLRSVTDQLEIPGQFPEVRSKLDDEEDTSVLYGRLGELDPLAASRIEPANRRRILRALEVTVGSGRPFSSFGPGLEQYPPAPFAMVGLEIDIQLLRDRIAARYDQQLEAGFLAEVEALRALPRGVSRTARQALGYRELFDHLENGTPLDEAVNTAITRTNQFARRQLRWFRRDPRIRWIPSTGSVDENALAVLVDSLEDSP
jgi:tRNA dimethylallyltransferase